MSSVYGIIEADITPGLATATVWTQLTTDPETSAAIDFDDILTPAEALFQSECGGLFTEAANLALAKPQVAQVVLWQAHFRRASHTDLPIPDDIVKAKDAALKWARETGQKLLAAEGTVVVAGQPEVQIVAPTARFTRDKMDLL